MKKFPKFPPKPLSRNSQSAARWKISPAEADLRQVRNLLNNIVDNSSAVIYVKDLAGVYLLVNHQFEVISGLDGGQIIGRDDFAIYPREVAEILRANDTAVVAGGKTQSIEETIPQLDGTRTYVSVKFPLRDACGKIYALAGISTDISAWKNAEGELRRQSVRAGILAELSQVLTSVTRDYQTVLETIVRRCAELIGDGASILMVEPGDPFLHLAAVYNPDPAAVGIFRAEMERNPIRVDEGAYNHVIKNAAPLLFPVVDIEKLKADPATSPERRLYYERLPLYSAMFAPLRAEGKTLGVLGVGRHHPAHPRYTEADLVFLQDIADRAALALLNARLYAQLEAELTERRRAEAQVQKLNAELEQRVAERTAQLEAANRELEAFSYSVSHDLRAPLRSINGFAKILQEDFAEELSPMARSFLGKISASGGKMSQLIDELLDFSRIGRKALNKQKFGLNALVRRVIDSLATETATRQIEWILSELPAVDADPALLQQVYVNLLGNAVKYTGRRAQARIEVGSFVKENQQIFFVRDNGAGFDMQYVGKLFGVFQRLHREDEFEGTGIGLAIARRIIERHGGRIWAEAEVERGATFFFTLQ